MKLLISISFIVTLSGCLSSAGNNASNDGGGTTNSGNSNNSGNQNNCQSQSLGFVSPIVDFQNIPSMTKWLSLNYDTCQNTLTTTSELADPFVKYQSGTRAFVVPGETGFLATINGSNDPRCPDPNDCWAVETIERATDNSLKQADITFLSPALYNFTYPNDQRTTYVDLPSTSERVYYLESHRNPFYPDMNSYITTVVVDRQFKIKSVQSPIRINMPTIPTIVYALHFDSRSKSIFAFGDGVIYQLFLSNDLKTVVGQAAPRVLNQVSGYVTSFFDDSKHLLFLVHNPPNPTINYKISAWSTNPDGSITNLPNIQFPESDQYLTVMKMVPGTNTILMFLKSYTKNDEVSASAYSYDSFGSLTLMNKIQPLQNLVSPYFSYVTVSKDKKRVYAGLSNSAKIAIADFDFNLNSNTQRIKLRRVVEQNISNQLQPLNFD